MSSSRQFLLQRAAVVCDTDLARHHRILSHHLQSSTVVVSFTFQHVLISLSFVRAIFWGKHSQQVHSSKNDTGAPEVHLRRELQHVTPDNRLLQAAAASCLCRWPFKISGSRSVGFAGSSSHLVDGHALSPRALHAFPVLVDSIIARLVAEVVGVALCVQRVFHIGYRLHMQVLLVVLWEASEVRAQRAILRAFQIARRTEHLRLHTDVSPLSCTLPLAVTGRQHSILCSPCLHLNANAMPSCISSAQRARCFTIAYPAVHGVPRRVVPSYQTPTLALM